MPPGMGGVFANYSKLVGADAYIGPPHRTLPVKHNVIAKPVRTLAVAIRVPPQNRLYNKTATIKET